MYVCMYVYMYTRKIKNEKNEIERWKTYNQ